MAGKLPYISQPGVIKKIMEKIKEAKTPDRFTYDFLETKLGCKGGNYKQFVSLAKKIGLLHSNGVPTELYKMLRNPESAGSAVAQAIKTGYREIFDRNEYAHDLDKEKLKGLVIEITGLDAKNRVVQLICQTFDILKGFADFDKQLPDANTDKSPDKEERDESIRNETDRDFRLGLSYTINLVLPKTDDPAVFNAIFRSLRDNLLRK